MNCRVSFQRIGCLIAILCSSFVAFAQAPKPRGQAAPISGFANTTACMATFNFSSGANAFNFCVTVNGNVTSMVSPAGSEQIASPAGDTYEGYNLCDSATGNNYYDFANVAGGSSGGWGTAAVSEPNGANTFPLSITRTSADGVFTLKQTFSRNTSDKYVKIVMALTNNVNIGRTVTLWRLVDFNTNGTFSDRVGRTHDSAYQWETGANGASYITQSFTVPHTTVSRVFSVGNASCSPSSIALDPDPGLNDYESLLGHTITFTGVQTKAVTLEIRRF